MLHVISGPDHLAAMAPLVIRRPWRSWMVGLRWGFGHTSGVLTMGVVALLLRHWLPMGQISAFSERLVGVLLIGLGAWGMRKALQIHSHEHQHGDHQHEHIHMHPAGQKHTSGHAHLHAAFGIGVLHGLAGSSHIVGILPALALPTSAQSLQYMVAYGAGTLAAMVFFSSAVATVAMRLSTRTWRAYRGLMLGASFAAVAIGVLWLAL